VLDLDPPEKTTILHLRPTVIQPAFSNAIQKAKGPISAFFGRHFMPNPPNGGLYENIVKQRTWLFANKTYFGDRDPLSGNVSPTER